MAAQTANPLPNTQQTSIDSRELVNEYYARAAGLFASNLAIRKNWPAPGILMGINSVAQPDAYVDGRLNHYFQFAGINVTTGDTAQVFASIDGQNFVLVPVTPLTTTPTATNTVTLNGIYSLVGAFYQLRVVITAGSNTGTTLVTLLSRM